MKKYLLIILTIFQLSLFAQDILIKLDSTQQKVKVLEVSHDEIKYKKHENLDGPVYILKIQDLHKIVYYNGEIEIFNEIQILKESEGLNNLFQSTKVEKTSAEKKYEEVTKNKNVLFLNFNGLLNSKISISYMYQFEDGKFSLHIPFGISFGKPQIDQNQLNLNNIFGGNTPTLLRNNYDIGLGLYYNTSGKRPITHFIGPLFRTAKYEGEYTSFRFEKVNGANNYYSENAGFIMNESSIMINNGFLYRFTPKFNMMLNFALGAYVHRSIQKENQYSSNVRVNRIVAMQLGFHLGYRF